VPTTWSDEALSDLPQIFDQMAARSPQFAGRFLERITASLERD
jgi:plasmid stabilization system protein ParE